MWKKMKTIAVDNINHRATEYLTKTFYSCNNNNRLNTSSFDDCIQQHYRTNVCVFVQWIIRHKHSMERKKTKCFVAIGRI